MSFDGFSRRIEAKLNIVLLGYCLWIQECKWYHQQVPYTKEEYPLCAGASAIPGFHLYCKVWPWDFINMARNMAGADSGSKSYHTGWRNHLTIPPDPDPIDQPSSHLIHVETIHHWWPFFLWSFAQRHSWLATGDVLPHNAHLISQQHGRSIH